MKLKRLAQVGLAVAASAIMVAGAQSSASASGPSVSIEENWGVSTFYPDGDWLYVHDTLADTYAVHGTLEQYVCANVGCDGKVWQELRSGCNDDTSIGDDGTAVRHCNYDVTEDITVRVCEFRSHDGVPYGTKVCSGKTQS
jgi:hypothetical protein